MNDEMVHTLNFGGYDGEDPVDKKKTREERHAEIMEKSKAYRFHAQEIKLANVEATRQLDEDWQDVAGLLNFKVRDSDQKLPIDAHTDSIFDDMYTKLKTEAGIMKIAPIQIQLTDKQKAALKR